MSTLICTVTSGRPTAFSYLARWVENQNTRDFHWLVVTDDSAGYTFPTKKCTVVRREPDGTDTPSICQNWSAALDWIEEREEYDKIMVMEDDDYYAKSYVHEVAKYLDQTDLFGWHEDAYYYVLSRKAKMVHNVGFACLASTAFTRKVIPYLRECIAQDNPFIDNLLWCGIREETFFASPPMIHPDGREERLPPVPYTRVKSSYQGSKMLVHNFYNTIHGRGSEMTYDEHGKIQIISHAPKIDKTGQVEGAYPRHVGMKEPWHRGKKGTSAVGHDCRMGGGPDQFGDKLREWIGDDDARWYIKLTKGISKAGPFPPMVLVHVPDAEDIN